MSHLFNSIKNLAGSYIQKDSNESSGESSREMRFNLSPPPGTLKGRGDAGRPIITDETNSSSDFNQWLHAMKMVARLPGGMPPEFRRKLWLALAEKYLKSKNVDWEKEEIKCFSEQWREDDEELGIQIVKDLHRTGSSLCSGPAGTINQAKLKRILLGYARYNPEVGYCQGFNMLGALILQVMDKEEIESIKVMIYLVEGILPRGYFSGSLGGLQADMAVFRELMTCKLPRLAKHLQKLQGPVENAFEPPLTNVFTMQWFLTMFCTCLPMTCVLRVWDLVLIEGSDVLLRTALVLWSLLEERILNARTADDFYCKMGSFSSELLNGHLIDSNGLIEKVVDLGPIPELQKLRDKHLYNISPFRDKTGLQLYYSDEEGDSDEDSRMAVATAWGLRLSRRGSAGLSNKTDGKDRITLDISLLKKQYDRLRERQRQAHIILTSAVARQGSNPNQSSIQMNQLLIGRNAIVTNNGRRLGPPQGAIPPARKPSLPTAKSPKPTQTKTLRRGETLHWRDTELSKRRRGSLKWKDIKSDSSQSGQDDRPPQLIESAPSSRSSSSEPKSQRGSLKARQRSDSSSYSEDSDGNSSTSTSLCDEDDHEIGNVSSLEGSPMKKSKKKHSEVPHKKCLEDVLNSNDKQHTVDSQIPFIQLTTMDSPVLNANKTDIDSIEYSKEDSETESNRLDYAGFVDEYSWPDINEATSSGPLEDITIDVTSDEGDFLSLSNVITSTSQLSPIPDITTYINNSNISPLRTPISTFNYANLVVSIDDSKKFDVNDEGVTNEYFERINIVERPTKLDLLYSLNEEDSIRNAYKTCQSSPEPAVHEKDSQKESLSPDSSKFLIYQKSTKTLPPSTEELDRKMKVLLEYSNQSSLSFIAEAKHEISTGMFKGREFDPKSLKYQPAALVPSNRASAHIKPAKDETIEHLFIIPSTEKRVEKASLEKRYDSESPVKISKEIKPGKILAHDSDSQCHPESTGSPFVGKNFDYVAQDEFKNDLKLGFEKKEHAVSKADQEENNSFEYLTQTADNFKPEKTLSELSSNERGALEVQQEYENQFKSTIQNSETFFGDGVCQIPSTEDLETRFKALEVTFTDRKGASSRSKKAENESKLTAGSWKESEKKESSTPKSEAQSEGQNSTDAIAPESSSNITDLPEVPKPRVLDEVLIVSGTRSPVKEHSLLDGEQKSHGNLFQSQHESVLEYTSTPDKPLNEETQSLEEKVSVLKQAGSLDKPLYDDNQTTLLEHKKEEYTFSKNESIKETELDGLVLKPTYDLDRSTLLTAERESDPDLDILPNPQNQSAKDSNLETTIIEATSGSEGPIISSTKNVSEGYPNRLLQSNFQIQSVKDFSSETSNPDLKSCTILSSKEVPEVDTNNLNQIDSQSELQSHSGQDDILKTSTTERTLGIEKLKVLSTKDVSEVDQGFSDKTDLQSVEENPPDQRSEKCPNIDDNLPAHPLSCSQDHFGNKEAPQLKLESPIALQSSSHFSKQNNVFDRTEESVIAHIQNSDQKNPCHLVNRAKLESLDREEGHDQDRECNAVARTENNVDRDQLTIDSTDVKNTEPSLLCYSEDHFGEKYASQLKLENLVLEQLQNQKGNQRHDSLHTTVEQIPTFLKDHGDKSENLDNQICVEEAPTYQNDKNSDPTNDKVSSKSKFHDPVVPHTVDLTRSQKPKIPSTEDLESRFMALERQRSEKHPPVIVDHSDTKDKLPKKESALNLDDTLPLKLEDSDSKIQFTSSKNTDLGSQVEVVSNKPIPSTADLEHRFRELERKLSSTNMTLSSKTTAPQEDHLKALKQSNIGTNPSIVLPDNENSTPSNTPSIINTSSKSNEDHIATDQPPFIRKRIPSTEDLESRFQALEIQKSLKSPTATTSNLLSPSKTKTEFGISTPEMETVSKRKSDIPSTEDLENRFQALEQSKLVQKPQKEVQNENQSDSSIPSTKVLESRFQALEQRKSIVDDCTKSKENETETICESKKEKESKTPPSALNLEMRFQALEQQMCSGDVCTKSNENETQISLDLKAKSNRKDQENKIVPSTEDLETRYEALEQQKSITDNCTKPKDIQSSSDSKTLLEKKERTNKKLPSTEDLESRFEALEQRKSINGGCTKSKENQCNPTLETSINTLEKPEDRNNFTLTQDLENRFDAIEGAKSIRDSKTANEGSERKEQNNKNVFSTQDLKPSDLQPPVTKKTSEENEKLKELLSPSHLSEQNLDKKSKIPSTQDLETRFEALEQKKLTKNDLSTPKDSTYQIAKNSNLEHKKISKVPSTHDLEKRFDDMQIDMKKTEQKDSKVEQKQELVADTVPTLIQFPNTSTEPIDQNKRKDLYKLESQSDETLTATDQTSTEFDTKTESRPTSCPEYSEPFDSNIVTTDRVLKIIEENSKILHRILKKTLADAGDNTDTTAQSKKSNSGITDSLLALGNIFPRSDETISPSRIKSHSWIRPSITLRSDDNISDRLASIKSTIKSIDTLCEEKSFRKEKCQRYIDSLFARPTITTINPANPSIKVEDFESKPSQERVPKRELKKDSSPRRRRVEDREEYESRVRRDMMPNSLDTPSDLSFSLANIEQVDSEVDRINQGKQMDTQMERPLSPYYVSGYDLNKRSITPVVYIPTKLEIRHTTVTSTFYDRYLTEKHMERTFPRSKKSPVSPTITKSYLDISNYSSINSNDRSSKSAENSPSRRKDGGGFSPNETLSSATNKRNLVSTLEVAKKDLHIRSCDNILLQLRSSTNNKDMVPSIMVYNPLPTKIRKPPELGISLGLYKDYGSDESSKS